MFLKKMVLLVKKLVLVTIRFYQKVFSPDQGVLFFGRPTCRFYPSCSQYAFYTIERFGVVKGSWLAIKRILKCHPLNEGGWDPVPNEFKVKG